MQEQVLLLYRQCLRQEIYFDIASGKRSFAEQEALFKQFVDLYGPNKVRPPGTSRHEAGMAIDIVIDRCVSYTEKYAVVGKMWEDLGFTWGKNDELDEYWHYEIKHKDYLKALSIPH